ncbi:MAG: hypothetical protein SNH99_01935 [Rikenellaceae bacterium]
MIYKVVDNRVVPAFTHKVADIPGGVTIDTSELTQTTLKEGTPIGPDTLGKYHVVKVAKLTAAATATATTYTVLKGHNFKVGDIIMLAEKSKGYAITAIATNSTDETSDDLTVGTTLGSAAAVGVCVYQSGSTGASNSAFKYTPKALVGEGYDVASLNEVFVNAWTVGQLHEGNIPALGDLVKLKLPGIILI